MKILLIRPPAKHVKGSARPSIGLPLGLLYIAAVLEENKFRVDIYDAQISAVASNVNDNSCGDMHIGDNWDEVKKEIIKSKPTVVGITNPYTAQFENTISTAEIAKASDSNIITIVGGNHPTVCPTDFFLKTKWVDIVCMGEGEDTMLEVVNALKEGKCMDGIEGIAFRREGKIVINRRRPYINDIDRLPFPAYHLVDMEHYFKLNRLNFDARPVWRYPGSQKAISFITSRGCPFDCIFCSIHLHMGKCWRFHSVDYIARHLEYVVSRYDIKHIHFEDDNLTLDPQRFKDIIKILKKPEHEVTWDTPNGIRPDTLSKEVLKSAKESGCTYIVLGVESGDQRVLTEIIDKKLNLGCVIKVAEWCKEIGLDAMAFFIIGFPGEKPEEMRKTTSFALRLMKKYEISPTVFIATPLLGTRLYDTCVNAGYIQKDPTAREYAITTGSAGIHSMIQTEDFSSDTIRFIMKRYLFRYKMIFLQNLFIFFLKRMDCLPRFIKALLPLTCQIGFKRALIILWSFRNCLQRNIEKGKLE